MSYARLWLILAAILWSTSSVFTRLLSLPTHWHLNEPRLDPLQMTFFRGLFAGLCLIPTLYRREIRCRPMMLMMMITFATMSGLYISALSLGSAANAILLQNTAPFWVYLIGVFILGEAENRKNFRAIMMGFVGALIIVIGNWPRGTSAEESSRQVEILLMATGSGITYAGIILFLSHLKHESSSWLTVINLLGTAFLIGLFILVTRGFTATWLWLTVPTLPQLLLLAIFGVFQMALPYWLFTRSLRTISPQEAGIITLLEPILNPIWAYLMSPETEKPTLATWLGGTLLLGALIWRYAPWMWVRTQQKSPPTASSSE